MLLAILITLTQAFSSTTLSERIDTYFSLVTTGQHLPYCPTDITSNEVVFMFEGAGGFAPKKSLIRKLNIDEFKSEDIEALCNATHDDKMCADLIKFLEPNSKENIAAAIMLDDAIEKIRHTNWYYFAQKNADEAGACANKILENNPNAHFKLLAYSMGGAAAIEFSNKHTDKIITNAFTIDPVPYKVLGKLTRPKSVPYWVNIYQKTDTTSMWVGIKGESLSGADINENVSELLGIHKKSGHIYIVKLPRFKEELQNFLNF